MIRDCELETFSQPCEGFKSILLEGGVVKNYDGLIPPVKPWVLVDVQLMLWRMELMIADFPMDHEIEPFDHILIVFCE